MGIGKEIKRLRTNKKLSVEAICLPLKIKPQRFRKWEERDTGPSDIEDIKKLEEWFGVTLNTLNKVKEISNDQVNKLLSIKSGKESSVLVENALHKITHDAIQMTAMMRVILRTQAEILSNQRGDSVTKVLSELSRAVMDETGAAVAAL